MKTVFLLDVGYLLPSQVKSVDMPKELLERVAKEVFGRELKREMKLEAWWNTYLESCTKDSIVETYNLFNFLSELYIGSFPTSDALSQASMIMKLYMDEHLVMGHELMESIVKIHDNYDEDYFLAAFGNCTVREKEWLFAKFPSLMEHTFLSCNVRSNVFSNDALHNFLCAEFGNEMIKLCLLTQHMNANMELSFDTMTPCPHEIEVVHGWVANAIKQVM